MNKVAPSLLAGWALCLAASALFGGSGAQKLRTSPLAPEEATRHFKVPADLRIEQVLAEPVVRQPVFLNFDERGRLWVVQYLQYPHPAGLKMLSRDSVWRAVYDKVPPPPPHQFVGQDKITIHESTRGDGVFDRHETFLAGLNLATAVARGRGGVWVLNPPYLLFYKGRDDDDVPDGPPEVRLAGFGLEDTHAVVNSLCWGPDGWLYGAQGSTVSANVVRPGLDKQPVHSMGQLIWRYHPETRRYEIFAEGGGNAFGVEIDSVGRVFSGHNGGDTRGFHYVQGGYYQKNFGKHGALSNPYAFGYFPAMRGSRAPRFTHTFALYEADTFPEYYRGKLFGVAPLLHHVVLSDVRPDGSSVQTQDLGHPVTTSDSWFTPVDIKLGPDGALYLADWYDAQCNHYRNHEGKIDKDRGRIYRLRAADAKPVRPFNLARLGTPELIKLLSHSNRWYRQTALRLIGDRKDRSVVPLLTRLVRENQGHLALEALWALNLSGGFDEPTALQTLAHPNPHVRLWAVRLLGDAGRVPPAVAAKLADLARTEPDVRVRSQLACSARRLPARDDLAIVRPLLARAEDADDVHLPLLLWWAIEAQAAAAPEEVLALFRDPGVWDLPLVRRHLTERLMRRFAATGRQQDLRVCARLLRLAPGPEHAKRLMAGFEAAAAGRSLTHLPDELARALAHYGKFSVVVGLRQGRKAAVDEALRALADPRGDRSKQLQYLQVFGELRCPDAVDGLLNLVSRSPDDGLRSAALTALQRYGEPRVAAAVLDAYPGMTDQLRGTAQALLASRRGWALQFLEAVEAGKVDARTVPPEAAQRLLRHRDARLTALVHKHWGALQPATPAELQKEIDRLAAVVRSGSGVPKNGQHLFLDRCAKCHTLFGAGGKVGPDLTAYQRGDLDSMLLAIVNPSAEIREGYVNYFVATRDGRAVSGLLVDQDAALVVLRGADGKDVPIARSDIEQLEASRTSLMPEGLLKGYSDQAIRDLFAYLRMTQPLIDR
jgi:putative membrane-bound dehydrogenase-like protein